MRIEGRVQLDHCYTAEQEDRPLKALHFLFAVLVSLASLQAQAQRLPVPIVNHENIAVERTSGRPPSAAVVRQAILSAQTGRNAWEFTEPTPGRIIATTVVNGKHTAMVEIVYTADHYSIYYKSSVNLKYKPGGNGVGVIHPFYNDWVMALREAIRIELAKT
jgi:hypothetical protein